MLRVILDEHLRGPLSLAIQRHNLLGGLPLDAVCVGDLPDVPLGSDDPHLLAWAEGQGRILVTQDKHTMPTYLGNHLKTGHLSPGVLMLRACFTVRELVECLELGTYVGEPAEYANAITHVP